MDTIFRVGLWVLIWTLVWIIFRIMNKNNIDFSKNIHISIIYFLIVSMMLGFLFYSTLSTLLVNEFDLVNIIIILLFISLNCFSILHFRKYSSEKIMKKHPKVLFLTLNKRYLIVKSFEIAFQQIMIILLVLWLRDLGFSLIEEIAIFAVLFGLSHLFLIKSIGIEFGLFFTSAALLSAVIFPTLILLVDYGFIYCYLIHWTFYVTSSIFIRKRMNK